MHSQGRAYEVTECLGFDGGSVACSARVLRE